MSLLIRQQTLIPKPRIDLFMCGRFALVIVKGFWTRFAVIDHQAQLTPRYNIAPTQEVPIIVGESPNKVVMMRWGLVPSWAKDPKIGNRLINARAETVSTKPAFRASLKSKRCLVPASGFYEWKRAAEGKVPYYIHRKDDEIFAFAGLYDRWKSPEGSEMLSFTIITTTPNSLMKEIHDRMPVILKREDEETWLAKDALETDSITRILSPYPARMLEAYRVSTAVNNPQNESEGLVKPVA